MHEDQGISSLVYANCRISERGKLEYAS
jgi:hypothetical protein